MAQDGKPAEDAKTDGEPGPAKPPGAEVAGGAPPVVGPVREASARPLEATAGVPDHGERIRPEDEAPDTGTGGPPAADAKAPAGDGQRPAQEKTQVIIIEAPEAKPVSEMTPVVMPSELKPVLPDEKGGVILDRGSGVEWGEEEKAGDAAKEGAPAPEAGPAFAAPEGAAPAVLGAPGAGERPGLPTYPALPRQFRGTGQDIRMFIRNGTFMFLAGSAVYFVAALYLLGMSLLSAPDAWDYRRAADFGVAGVLALMLSVGAFACMLLSRYRLEEPLRRNDVATVRRRLPVAVGAGYVFGLALGGVLLQLARTKVDELPFPAAAAKSEEAAGEEV